MYVVIRGMNVFDTLLSDYHSISSVIPFLRVGRTLAPHLLYLCMSIEHSVEGVHQTASGCEGIGEIRRQT